MLYSKKRRRQAALKRINELYEEWNEPEKAAMHKAIEQQDIQIKQEEKRP